MGAYLGKSRPIASVGAVVITADGERFDLGTIAGKGSEKKEEIEKGREGRAHLAEHHRKLRSKGVKNG